MITLLAILLPVAAAVLGAWVGYGYGRDRGQLEGWRQCRRDEEDAS